MNCNNVQSILEVNQCTGCCGCASVCPTSAIGITKDAEGFIIPCVDYEKCIQCGKCRTICPAITVNTSEPLVCYAGISKSKEFLMKSSSGAIFPVIASMILEKGGVVYGATMTSDFSVRHIRIEESDKLSSILGSKYMQSYMGFTYKAIMDDLITGKTVLFSGTPCMTSAVRNIFCNVKSGKLILVDLVCHGVPSQDFFGSYLSYLSERVGKIDYYRFRAKRYEKNGMNCFLSYRTDKGNKDIIYNWPEDPFNYMYMMAYIYRESCYNCKYACSKRPGDITLCDFWGWDKYHTDFAIGSTVSGILINTDIGKDIFDSIKSRINYVKTEYANIRDNNGCLLKPSSRPKVRDYILNEWKREGFAAVAYRYGRIGKKAILKAKLVRIMPASIIGIYNIIGAKRNKDR